MAQSENVLAANAKPDLLSSIHPWDLHCRRKSIPTQVSSELNMHDITHTPPQLNTPNKVF